MCDNVRALLCSLSARIGPQLLTMFQASLPPFGHAGFKSCKVEGDDNTYQLIGYARGLPGDHSGGALACSPA